MRVFIYHFGHDWGRLRPVLLVRSAALRAGLRREEEFSFAS